MDNDEDHQRRADFPSRLSRRRFLLTSGLAFGALVRSSRSGAFELHRDAGAGSSRSFAHTQSALCNINVRTLIGLGDEPAGIVDKYGQLLRSRQAAVRLRFGRALQPAETAATTLQSLVDGYLPFVQSQLSDGNRAIAWNAFSSDHSEVKADYVEVTQANDSFELTVVFPRSASIRVERGYADGG